MVTIQLVNGQSIECKVSSFSMAEELGVINHKHPQFVALRENATGKPILVNRDKILLIEGK